VYEKGHILVLAWADTQRDREVIWKILSQVRCRAWNSQHSTLVCCAHRCIEKGAFVNINDPDIIACIVGLTMEHGLKELWAFDDAAVPGIPQ
jgi:hypothetical protein